MVPALCVLARQVEPDRRGFRANPGHRSPQGMGVKCLEVGVHLGARLAHQVHQKHRADAACHPYPFFVPAIEKGDQFVPPIHSIANRVPITPS